MPVMFKTQQGRVLYNSALSAADVTRAIDMFAEVLGEELVGNYSDGRPILRDGTTFHANTRHIVEWWDTKVGA